MHKTAAGERAKALKKEAVATMRTARVTVMNLQSMAAKRLSQAQALKLEARLEDLQVWEQKKVKDTKKGAKTYTYFMTSWREGKRIRSVYLGSSHKMSREQAQEKARALKREALGLSSLTLPESGN